MIEKVSSTRRKPLIGGSPRRQIFTWYRICWGQTKISKATINFGYTFGVIWGVTVK